MNARVRGLAAQQNRERILKRDNGLCVHCLAAGKATIATEVDHIIPLFKGGTDDDDNKQSLCHPHHSDKSARDMGKKARGSIGLDGIPLSPSHHWNR